MKLRAPSVLLSVLLAAFLAGCATHPRTEVRAVQSAMDQAALEAGDLRIAASALQSGDLNVARSLYGDLARSHPGVPAVWLGLGDTYFLSGEYETARTAYERAEKIDPTQLDPHLALARVAVRMRKLDDARERFKAILVQHPDQPIALAGLGVVYDLTNRPDLAQATYRKGLKAHPGNEALRTDLGLSLALSGKPREAINVLLGNSGVTGGLPQTRDNLALAYGLLGRDDAAESILTSYQSRGQVQDNLEFYRYLRGRLAQGGSTAKPAAVAADKSAAAASPVKAAAAVKARSVKPATGAKPAKR